MDAKSESRLAQVYPGLAERIRQISQTLAVEAIRIGVTQGLRSWALQDGLYAHGRTSPGPKVTNAPGGYSWHCFGLAVDVDDLDSQGKPIWNPAAESWKRIVQVGESVGLRSGIAWADEPHFELTGHFSGSLSGAEGDEVRQLFKDGGIEAVWDEAFKMEATS